MKIPDDEGTCSLCGSCYTHGGHNPWPLRKFRARCCQDCRDLLVIPARLRAMIEEQTRIT